MSVWVFCISASMEDEILFPEIALFHSNCKQSSNVISKISKSRRRRQKIEARLLMVEEAVRKETPPSVPKRPPPPPCSVQEADKKTGILDSDQVSPPLSHIEGKGINSERVDLPKVKFLVVEGSQMKKLDSSQGCRYGLRPR